MKKGLEATSDNDKGMIVKWKPKGSNEWIQKDLIQFIEDAKTTRPTDCGILTKKGIMVMGLSGTGKSTLVNYLNDVPLVCMLNLVKMKWNVVLESEKNTLPCGFSIGSGHVSETFYPAYHTPYEKDFTYIDNPGFDDTHGIGREISNSFLRKQIAKDMTHLKFLLLITHADFKERGYQFRDTIRIFSGFLGIFDDIDKKNLSRSFGFIITKVEKIGASELEIRQALSEVMLNILADLRDQNRIKKEIIKVFENSIQLNQFEIFSNPQSHGKLNNSESLKIQSMINNLSYISKEDAKIQIRIASSYYAELSSYKDKQFKEFMAYLQQKLESSINKYFEAKLKVDEANFKERVNNTEITIAESIYKVLSTLNNILTQKIDFETFLKSIDENILTNNIKDKLNFKMKILNFFDEIIPNEYKTANVSEQQWITVALNNKINNLMEKLINYVNYYYNRIFPNYLERVLDESLSNYFPKKLDSLIYLQDLKTFENKLNAVLTMSQQEINFDEFINSIDKEILNVTSKDEFLSNYQVFMTFAKLLPIEKQVSFLSKKKWTVNLQLKLQILINELKQYYIDNEPDYDHKNGIYIQMTNFAKMSSVLAKIEKDDSKNNLKSIRIYATNSFIFDVDYSIKYNRYSANAPDLIIITPILIVNAPITIDLSVSRSNKPGYPDNTVKASNGIGYGKAGNNGKPGLPGYNGGNLFILADLITNVDNLKFVSVGGEGGPGQNG